MLEIIKYVVNQFADKPEDVEYSVEEKGNAIEVTVLIDEEDMGKAIGRQGKIAKALRTIVNAVSKKNGNAVTRVRIKRQVRAMVSRHFDCKPRLNLIIVIRPSYSPEEKVGNEEELAKALAEIKDTAIE